MIAGIIHQVGKKITLNGWIDTKRDHGKMTFIELRDQSGKVQCIYRGVSRKDLSFEDVIQIEGTVATRPDKLINLNEPLGKYEVHVDSITVLNKSKELPIPVDGDGRDIKEEMRLQYRYLDLRRPRMQKNLRMRSAFLHELRVFLVDRGVVEIETPILTKATKEGARDFVVPSRLQPGCVYALPQSPQQYKQLLMASGFESYFQIAKCFRDEGLRQDRAFEFTQLDMEFAYPTTGMLNSVMSFVNEMLWWVLRNAGIKMGEVPIYTYEEAMKKYGTDKPKEGNEKFNFCWVVRYPFFKKSEEKTRSGWTFTHNPFSRPVKEHEQWHLAGQNIDQIITEQYDLICNGVEIGGGSLRAHESDMLRATYKIMGYTDAEIESSVGHMLRAFELGTPPHGGIALGVDRLVMMLNDEESIKEVTAFPMSSSGRTSVMDAPSLPEKEEK